MVTAEDIVIGRDPHKDVHTRIDETHLVKLWQCEKFLVGWTELAWLSLPYKVSKRPLVARVSTSRQPSLSMIDRISGVLLTGLQALGQSLTDTVYEVERYPSIADGST